MKIKACKTNLFGGVALAALLASQGAMAAEWEIGLRGFVETDFGLVGGDVDTPAGARDFDGLGATGQSELEFNPRITLDNGLKIGSVVQFEGRTSSEQTSDGTVDEASIYVRGSFGTVILGKTDVPGQRLNESYYGSEFSSSVTSRINQENSFNSISRSAIEGFVPLDGAFGGVQLGDDLTRGTLGSTLFSASGEENAVRIAYFSPTIAGFQVGASFAPDGSGSQPDRENMTDVALRYAGEFGAIRVAASGYYSTAENERVPMANPEGYGFGANFGYGGFNIGGSWAESNGSAMGITDGEAFSFHATQELNNDWSIGARYHFGRNTDDEHAGFGPKESLETFTVVASKQMSSFFQQEEPFYQSGEADLNTDYRLKKGVRLDFFASHVNFNEDVGDPGFGTPGNNVSAWVIGTGIRYQF